MALLLGTMVVAATPAAAAHVQCGQVITQSVRLDGDVGPCPGDGLIIRASNITVNLNGHRVFAAQPNGPLENVGIRMGMVSGVTVQNGTVEGFDAGVFINGGGNNTIQRLTVRNNINDMAEPFAFVAGQGTAQQPDVASGRVTAQEWNAQMLCFFGDGITTESSDNNLIQHNRVLDNGPFGGITLVGDSDGNRIQHNQVAGNNISNWTTRANGQAGTGLCGATLPGAPGMQRGREVQAIGIRLEGPGADDNVIQHNVVTQSALVGISIHSYVCRPQPGEPRPGFPNEQNLITNNSVTQTGSERRRTAGGFQSAETDPFADGIASLAQGPIGTVTCTSHNNSIIRNASSDNDRHGIALHPTVENTTVDRNVANNNGGHGVSVARRAVNNSLTGNSGQGNAQFDGFDGNDNCDNNDWERNRFRTVNQPCVADGPGNSGNAPGQGGGPNPA
ncbi:MAG: right-handed parallel beta-helix repeat-containing protein [Actinomycetota bacterium]|nr:right-handed parallel beta-helix repeat-containing protein [Actinomycetota bacterium]